MNWLQKIAKIITMEETPQDILATLNYKTYDTTPRIKWFLDNNSNLPVSQQRLENGIWWNLAFLGFKDSGVSPNADYILKVHMTWKGQSEDQYENKRGRQGLEFFALLTDENEESLTSSYYYTQFETAEDIANWVKDLVIEDDEGGDDFEGPGSDFTPPQEYVPENNPSDIFSESDNDFEKYGTALKEEYEIAYRIFQDALDVLGRKAARDIQQLWNYMGPRLRNQGLDPRKWINYFFKKMW